MMNFLYSLLDAYGVVFDDLIEVGDGQHVLILLFTPINYIFKAYLDKQNKNQGPSGANLRESEKKKNHYKGLSGLLFLSVAYMLRTVFKFESILLRTTRPFRHRERRSSKKNTFLPTFIDYILFSSFYRCIFILSMKLYRYFLPFRDAMKHSVAVCSEDESMHSQKLSGARQTGQLCFLGFSLRDRRQQSSKQERQKACPQAVIAGITIMSRQIGHKRWSSFKIAESYFTDVFFFGIFRRRKRLKVL